MVRGNDPEMEFPETPRDATCGSCDWCIDPCGCLSREDSERVADFGICTVERDAPVLVRRDWTAHDERDGMPCGGDFWSGAHA